MDPDPLDGLTVLDCRSPAELVRAWAIYTRGERCEDCRAGGVLDLHHLTYAHRGEEIFHMEDMRLLCRACHDARHGLDGDGGTGADDDRSSSTTP